MKKSMYRRIIAIVCLSAIVLMFCGCGTYTATVVKLNREKYTPKFEPTDFSKVQGKQILLSSINDLSKNTTNLAYFNPERTVGYELYYSSQHSLSQPVVSFFWYSLQKGFEQAGIKIIEDGPLYDAEMNITINSLTDEEVQFNVLLTKAGKQFYKKDYVVKMANDKSTDPAVLEERAYKMIDSMVKTILNDEEFHKAVS